jgi:hypothetical protein
MEDSLELALDDRSLRYATSVRQALITYPTLADGLSQESSHALEGRLSDCSTRRDLDLPHARVTLSHLASLSHASVIATLSNQTTSILLKHLFCCIIP